MLVGLTPKRAVFFYPNFTPVDAHIKKVVATISLRHWFFVAAIIVQRGMTVSNALWHSCTCWSRILLRNSTKLCYKNIFIIFTFLLFIIKKNTFSTFTQLPFCLKGLIEKMSRKKTFIFIGRSTAYICKKKIMILSVSSFK